MGDQVRPIEDLTLAELEAVREDHGDNTAPAVLEAIEAKKQPAAPAVKAAALAPRPM